MTTPSERLVVKHAYVDRQAFEPGLLAAEALAAAGWRAATPHRTRTGELSVMVEWPEGSLHPLALLDHVDGHPAAPTIPAGAERVGLALGTVQRTLLQAGPIALGLDKSEDYLGFLRTTHEDLGEYSSLHLDIRRVLAVVDELTAASSLTVAPGVWDGPEIYVDSQRRSGLVDFGHVSIHPVAHVLAYGTTQVSPPGRRNSDRTRIFLDAFLSECPVTDADLEAIPAFRKVTVALHAKIAATRHAAGFLAPWMEPILAAAALELCEPPEPTLTDLLRRSDDT